MIESKQSYKRVVTLPSGTDEKWRHGVKDILDKLGAKCMEEDLYKFRDTGADEEVTVEYSEASTDIILGDLDKCGHLKSRRIQ